MLVHRSRHRDALGNRSAGKSRQQSVELRTRGAVAFNSLVALFEHDPPGHTHGLRAAEGVGKIAGEDQHTLAVYRAAELCLTLDVHDTAATGSHGRGDPVRTPEAVIAETDNCEPVYLSDP